MSHERGAFPLTRAGGGLEKKLSGGRAFKRPGKN